MCMHHMHIPDLHSLWDPPWCNISHKPRQTHKHLSDICQHLNSQHPAWYIRMAQILSICIIAVRQTVKVE